MTTRENSVPYFCQWESSSLAGDIIAGRVSAADDSRWASSGAYSVVEYVLWASHICGMACLKMILAARTRQVYTTMQLVRLSMPYGVYVEHDGDIRGLIYAPFVTFLREVFEMQASVVTDIAATEIRSVMFTNEFFMASVHPTIRNPTHIPPQTGGHLVLVTGATDEELTFHNPSGHDASSQANVNMPVSTFGRFFAGRGIAIPPA
jgi:hypothetical protein